MAPFRIDFAVALGLAVLLALAAFGAAFLYYRTTVPPVAPLRRAVLAGMRALGLALMILLLCEPVLHLRFSHTSPPVLAVLVDDSRSMRIVDREGDRAARLRTALENPVFTRLGSRAELRYFSFGARLRLWRRQGGDTLPLNEGVTDIAGALQSLGSEQEHQHFDAAVLLSDGVYTLGREPLGDAERLGLPLFTVGIGDSSEQKDLVVTRTAANELVYADTRAPVSVTVRSAGFNGERVEVTLSEGGRVLDRAPLTLEPGTREYTVDLSYVPQGEGFQRYTAAVSVLPGELTAANNHRSFTARVLRSKLRVLILAGQPSPDVPVTAQTLREEKNFSVLSYTEDMRGGFFEGNLPLHTLDSADCLVLMDFPAAWTPAGLLQEIAARLTSGKASLFFVAGKAVDYGRLQAIAEALPFTASQVTASEQLVSLQPSEEQREHPVLNAGDGVNGWNDLPPVYRRFGLYSAKPGAVTLGTTRIQRTLLHEPLLLARSLNRSKTVALLAYGIWRWRLMAQDAPGTAPLLSAFLMNTVKWLTTPDDRRPVRVATTQESFSQGQPVEFTGQVYNQSAEPVDNAALKVVARQKDLSYETDLRALGGGRFEGSLEGLPEGEFTFQAAATLNGASLGEDRGRFAVGELDLELQETRMNSLLLRQLAFRTGGSYFSPAGLDRLDSVLSARPVLKSRTVVRASDTELWHWQWLLAGIIALFAAEWTIRKVSGML